MDRIIIIKHPEKIKEIEEYIPLPGQYEINEYRIMEEFIYDLPEGRNQDTLERTIQGKGATLNDRYIYK